MNQKRNTGGILVLAPHQDDECLQTAGVIYAAVTAGRPVTVCFATNGEYLGESYAAVRAAESRRVLAMLGVPREQVLFLGYPDTGMPYEESFLRRLYDGKPVSSSRWGRSETWTPDGQDFHYLRHGCHGTYTAASVLEDLRDLLELVRPEELYVSAPGDCHGDHDSLGRFAEEAVRQTGQAPRIYHYLIHADATDRWPDRPSRVFAASRLPDGSSFRGREAEHRPLPPGFSPGDKRDLIAQYVSQDPPSLDGYLLAFAKEEELLFPAFNGS